MCSNPLPAGDGPGAPGRAQALLARIRAWLVLFILGLVLSGATAIPLGTELQIVDRFLAAARPGGWVERSGLPVWIGRVRTGVVETNGRYPFIAYGTDWLAFGHFVIALAFLGPLRDPVKNIWVVEFGMLACVLVVPFALGMGALRGIPFGWRLIDCSFGVFGIVPLWICRRQIQVLARLAG